MRRSVLLSISMALVTLAVAGCGAGASPTAAPEGPAPTAVPPTATPATPAEEAASPTPTAVPPTATPIPPAEEAATPTPAPTLEISSGAFEPGGEIPIQYTCEGANLSPLLEWSGVPEGTQSVALLLDDPDSQPPGFVHWVVYNIPSTSEGLPEGVPAEASLPDGTLQGTNDFALYVAQGETFPGGAPINLIGYDGPCPGNQHRYVFTLYALDALLDLPAEATMAEVLQAMEGRVLGQVELTGVYTPQP